MINQVTQGDCLEVMKAIPDGSIDMILCDLPYGTTASKWDVVIPFDALWREYRRILAPRGVVVLTASQPFTAVATLSNPEWFRHEWIWLKNKGSNFANTVREPMKEHESVLVFSPGKWTYNKQMQERTGGGASRAKYAFKRNPTAEHMNPINADPVDSLPDLRVPSSWQKFNVEHGLHINQKPVALFEYLIRTYTNPGETVLDNCAGSGTTAIAALNTGRRFICIEQDAGYVEIARARVASHQMPEVS